MGPSIYIDRDKINLKDSNDQDVTLFAGPTDGWDDKPSNKEGYSMVMPVKLKFPEKKFWNIPVEPFVSINGGNVIARRTVAKGKGRGTIKERWTQSDYNITIEGFIINYDNADVYPEEDVKKLREFCEATTALGIECDLLKYFDISHFCIEKFDFPFTKGANMQRYSISGYSDDLTELLVEDIEPLTTKTE